MSRDYLKEIFDIDTSKLDYSVVIFKPDDKYIQKIMKMYDMSIHEMRCIVKETDVSNNHLSDTQYAISDGLTVQTLSGREFSAYSGMIGGYKIRYQRGRTVVIQNEKKQRQLTYAPEILNSIPISVIEMIMKMMMPLDILSWFQVNRHYAKMGRDTDLICRLLNVYFPNLYHTTIPKLQFVAATYGAMSFYVMQADEDDTFRINDDMHDEVPRHEYSAPVLQDSERATCRINALPEWSTNRMKKDGEIRLCFLRSLQTSYER